MSRTKNFILLIFLSFAGVLPQPSFASEALLNSEVSVDETGKDAADARSQAMTKAQATALEDLLNKLATNEQVHEIMTNLDAARISSMTRGTEVLEEKISSNRYRARLVVSFDGSEISNLIGKSGPQSQSAEPATVGSFLILPAYEEEGNVTLWEDSNPWRPVWRTVGLEITSGDIIVPFGDNADIGVVDAKTLASANYSSLTPLMVRYGVSDVIALQAKYTRAPDMQLSVVKRHINRTSNEVNLLTYRADAQETKEMLLARAARDIVENALHKKTEETDVVKMVRGGDRNTVMLLASISTLSSWTQLRGKLSSLPMIDRLEILAISPQQVDIIVHYRGSAESLAAAITAQNLRLAQNPDYWVVSRD